MASGLSKWHATKVISLVAIQWHGLNESVKNCSWSSCPWQFDQLIRFTWDKTWQNHAYQGLSNTWLTSKRRTDNQAQRTITDCYTCCKRISAKELPGCNSGCVIFTLNKVAQYIIIQLLSLDLFWTTHHPHQLHRHWKDTPRSKGPLIPRILPQFHQTLKNGFVAPFLHKLSPPRGAPCHLVADGALLEAAEPSREKPFPGSKVGDYNKKMQKVRLHQHTYFIILHHVNLVLEM